MSQNNLSLEALKGHLFETLEGVKNLSDPEASPNEVISLDQAKSIVDISGKIIDVYKTQLDAVQLAHRMDDVASSRVILEELGTVDRNQLPQICGGEK